MLIISFIDQIDYSLIIFVINIFSDIKLRL